jgi:L-ribulose-5-phosphate 3-epimerase
MAKSSFAERLGVCSWSLQPADLPDLLHKLEATGVKRVQLALDPLREKPAAWKDTAAAFGQHGCTIISGMFGCVGEDYSTLETIRETGGIAPDRTWEQNWRNIQQTATLATELKLKLVTFHAGFLPHDPLDPQYAKLKARLLQIAELFTGRGLQLGLETGQETAHDLAALLKNINQPNLGVNFDPANMILYEKGNPIEALRTLAPFLQQVHIKDANRTKLPGTWGEEVPAGTGQVDWKAFFATLTELGFAGNLVIEREAGSQRVADIQTAKRLVEKMSIT